MKKLLFSISITLLSGLFALCNPVDRIENRSENDHKLANSLFDNQKAYVNNSTKSASELENIYAKNKKKGKATDCALGEINGENGLMYSSLMCTTPGAPQSVTATATGPNSASLDWVAGNPAGSETVSYYWVVGTTPTVSYNNGVVQGITTGTWAGATGLFPGITYYLRVYAVSSCNNIGSAYGTSNAFTTGSDGNCITPGTPVNVTATGTGPNSASFDWATGNPSGSLNVVYYWVVGASASVTDGYGV